MLASKNPHNEVNLAVWDYDDLMELTHKINSANAAQSLWASKTAEKRCELIIKLAELIDQHEYYWAMLITVTMGKPISAALKEIAKSTSALRYFAKSELLSKKKIESSFSDTYEILQPLGVVYAVMPWNYPVWQVIRVLAPNLLLGNAIVLAHSPNVHVIALALEQVVVDAGLPKGLLTAVRPEYKHSEEILHMPAIKGLAFTGSDRVGAILAGYAGSALKPSTLECGGSDPYIVLSDADLPKAAETIKAMRLNNAGQVCISAKRVIVIQDIYDKFIKLIYDQMEPVKYADPMNLETVLGPLARDDIRDRVHALVQSSISLGAKCLLGGTIPKTKGFYYPATLLIDVTSEMPVFQEEVFGPVMCLIKAENEEHAIALANQNKYGLGGAVFSENLANAEAIAKKLNVGTCMINRGVSSDPSLPFGGLGRSGFGRELGRYGIKAFANVKIVGR